MAPLRRADGWPPAASGWAVIVAGAGGAPAALGSVAATRSPAGGGVTAATAAGAFARPAIATSGSNDSRVVCRARTTVVRCCGTKPGADRSMVIVPVEIASGAASGSVPRTTPSMRTSALADPPRISSRPTCSPTVFSASLIAPRFFPIQGSDFPPSASVRCSYAATQRPSACSASPICARARGLFSSW